MYIDALDLPHVCFGTIEDLEHDSVKEDLEFLDDQDAINLADLADEGWFDPQE